MTTADAAAAPPKTATAGGACPPNPVSYWVEFGAGDCPRCHAPITAAQMKQIYTAAPDDRLEEARAAFNGSFEKFSINH